MTGPKRTDRANEVNRRRGDETAAARLRAHGWLVIPPEDLKESTVTTYTVQVEASNADGTIWQAVAPSETVNLTAPGWTPQKVAEMAARDQTEADGHNWRVRVWTGGNADTSSASAAEIYGEESA